MGVIANLESAVGTALGRRDNAARRLARLELGAVEVAIACVAQGLDPIAAFEREFVEAQKAAYMETCIEDDEMGERMDAGRKALLARGDNEVGPYQSPMEDGMQHFHEWYREAMGSGTIDPAAAKR